MTDAGKSRSNRIPPSDDVAELTNAGRKARDARDEALAEEHAWSDQGRREAFGRAIHQIRTEVFHESLRAFSARTGISTSYLGRLENGEVGIPRRGTIASLAAELDAPPAPLLLAAGYLPDSDAEQDPGDVALALLFKNLSQRDKQLLRGLISTMQSTPDRHPGAHTSP
jgi:transcriptional regulator with XRE-family HTH domain